MKLYQLVIGLLYLLYSIDSCKGQVTESTESTGDEILKKISSILDSWPKVKLISFSFFNHLQQAEHIVGVSTVATKDKIANQEADTTTADTTTDITGNPTDTVTEPFTTEVGVTEVPFTEETTGFATETELETTEATEIAGEDTETSIFETTEPEFIETLSTSTRRSIRTTRSRVPRPGTFSTRTPSYQCICWYVMCGHGRGRHNHQRKWHNNRREVNEPRYHRRGNRRSQRRRSQRRRPVDYDNAYNKWIRSNPAFYQNYYNNDYVFNFNPYEQFSRRQRNRKQSTFLTMYVSPYENFFRHNGRFIDNEINGNSGSRNGVPQERTFISNYFSPYEQFARRNRIRKENIFLTSYFSPYENYSRRTKFEGIILADSYWQSMYYPI